MKGIEEIRKGNIIGSEHSNNEEKFSRETKENINPHLELRKNGGYYNILTGERVW